ncbi:hypothetical protein DV515_00016108 [Chloebia gouldiae]|uniref:Guanine nucleotide-binding protein subunit gamma n=1 Tax=Chloebia gouldiae TaxID=44316 RepID=A0A3L8RT85_CHLGU|nr:hypothetical protein DV515_00016108 [Chloebia gouldiae]
MELREQWDGLLVPLRKSTPELQHTGPGLRRIPAFPAGMAIKRSRADWGVACLGGRGLARWAWPPPRCGRPWRARERRSDHYTDKIKASWTGSKSAYVVCSGCLCATAGQGAVLPSGITTPCLPKQNLPAPCSTTPTKMSGKTATTTNNIAQARRTVQQLRIEASIERIKVSKASADLMLYCEEHAKKDPLLMGIPASENPFKDKKTCILGSSSCPAPPAPLGRAKHRHSPRPFPELPKAFLLVPVPPRSFLTPSLPVLAKGMGSRVSARGVLVAFANSSTTKVA